MKRDGKYASKMKVRETECETRIGDGGRGLFRKEVHLPQACLVNSTLLIYETRRSQQQCIENNLPGVKQIRFES